MAMNKNSLNNSQMLVTDSEGETKRIFKWRKLATSGPAH